MGEKVKAIWISRCSRKLVFLDDVGHPIMYETENDCCNDVWFNAIQGLDALKRHEVFSVEACGWRDMEALSTDGDVVTLCWWKLKTPDGICSIEVRNTHNGYYGGKIRRMDWGEMEKEWPNWRNSSDPAPPGWERIKDDFEGRTRDF